MSDTSLSGTFVNPTSAWYPAPDQLSYLPRDEKGRLALPQPYSYQAPEAPGPTPYGYGGPADVPYQLRHGLDGSDYVPSEGLGQKLLDYASVPARLMVNGLTAPFQQLDQAQQAIARDPLGPISPATAQAGFLGTAGLGLLGSGFERPQGSLGVFAGRSAKTADLDSLQMAKRMEREGLASRDDANTLQQLQSKVDSGPHGVANLSDPEIEKFSTLASSGANSPEAIHAATGWFRGVDGQWRYEIPDTGAQFTNHAPVVGPRPDGTGNYFDPGGMRPGTTLGDVLDHPALFRAYPELAQVPVAGLSDAAQKMGARGEVRGDGTIGLGQAAPPDVISTLVHELQHKIQDSEGFATGGNTNEMLAPGMAETIGKHGLNDQFFNDEITEQGKYPELVKRAFQRTADGTANPVHTQVISDLLDAKGPGWVADYAQHLREGDQIAAAKNQAFRDYQSLAGETEARNVQYRLDAGSPGAPLTDYPLAPEHAALMPSPGDQLVRFGPPGSGTSFDGIRAAIGPVFHGTPHTFEPVEHNPFGEFQDKAIGSGEGAQAYGWGHYLAGDQGIAEYYRDALSQRKSDYYYDGNKIDRQAVNRQTGYDPTMNSVANQMDTGKTAEEAIKYLRDEAQDGYIRNFVAMPEIGEMYKREDAKLEALDPSKFYAHTGPEAFYDGKLIDRSHPDTSPTLHDIAYSMAESKMSGQQAIDRLKYITEKMRDNPRLQAPEDRAVTEQHLAELAKLDPSKLEVRRPSQGGNLYKAVLDTDEENLLHLDRTLDQQSPTVQKALEQLSPGMRGRLQDLYEQRGQNSPWDAPEAYTGRQLLKGLEHYDVSDEPSEVSEALAQAGIHGHMFADANSRGAVKRAQAAIQEHQGMIDHFRAMQDNLPPESPAAQKLHVDFQNHIDHHQQELNHHQQTIDQASHNYVVFNPRHIKIIGRNGEELGLEPVDNDPFQGAPP